MTGLDVIPVAFIGHGLKRSKASESLKLSSLVCLATQNFFVCIVLLNVVTYNNLITSISQEHFIDTYCNHIFL